ncbi:DEAD/DEAH box helicase [Cohnella pontilimi]|uniref:RNA helicase n=1 Tax=Cohnella pontilimi TaxID=2564100 RepID=A0A4U0F594_9BACL|nr:DEAD/DEAH box helicase [Cohnella pontilimi]TJY39756.1 DEAD/DEAH box helicase [Cohnella pontilimi]
MPTQPLHTFEGLGITPQLAETLSQSGITAPSPVQTQAIPPILNGRDSIIVSPTGTGKTLAYLLPVLQRLNPERRETQAVVLAPTQELAMQIVREAETYGTPLGIKTVALIGGASLSRQLDRMKTKPALVVGTPGRIMEVVSLKKLVLPNVRHVVVDETDRVFSLGGKKDVERLLRQCAKERQTIFVSATRSDAMKEAERQWMKEPAETSAEESQEGGEGLPSTIRHWYLVSDRRDKIDLVRRLVHHLRMKPALLFLNDIEKIGELASKLKYEGVMVDTLYGDTPGRERGQALGRFRSGKTALLIATDLAARGLDVPGLPLVIQFEPALDADHYVHRAGRTGRMGKEGVSITLITPQERFIVDKLSKQLGIEMAPKTFFGGRLYSPEEAEEARGRKNGHSRGEPVKPVKPVKPASAPQRKSAAAGTPSKPGTKAANGPSAKAKGKADRTRDLKNKGAPRWLKQKREAGPPSDTN